MCENICKKCKKNSTYMDRNVFILETIAWGKGSRGFIILQKNKRTANDTKSSQTINIIHILFSSVWEGKSANSGIF